MSDFPANSFECALNLKGVHLDDLFKTSKKDVIPVHKNSNQLFQEFKDVIKPVDGMDDIISKIVNGGNDSDVLLTSPHQITRQAFNSCAKEREWLACCIIDHFSETILTTDTDTIVFNSMFYTKLYGFTADSKYDYSEVKRWTKNVDIFTQNLLLIPLFVNKSHYCIVAIYFKEKCIFFYDSMNYSGKDKLKIIMRYLHDEHIDKKCDLYHDLFTFQVYDKAIRVTQQHDGYDCGIFVMIYLQFLSSGIPLSMTSQISRNHVRQYVASKLISAMNKDNLQPSDVIETVDDDSAMDVSEDEFERLVSGAVDEVKESESASAEPMNGEDGKLASAERMTGEDGKSASAEPITEEAGSINDGVANTCVENTPKDSNTAMVSDKVRFIHVPPSILSSNTEINAMMNSYFIKSHLQKSAEHKSTAQKLPFLKQGSNSAFIKTTNRNKKGNTKKK